MDANRLERTLVGLLLAVAVFLALGGARSSAQIRGDDDSARTAPLVQGEAPAPTFFCGDGATFCTGAGPRNYNPPGIADCGHGKTANLAAGDRCTYAGAYCTSSNGQSIYSVTGACPTSAPASPSNQVVPASSLDGCATGVDAWARRSCAGDGGASE